MSLENNVTKNYGSGDYAGECVVKVGSKTESEMHLYGNKVISLRQSTGKT